MAYWNSDLYLRFADERTRPAVDLASAIVHPDPRRIVDLGCGPGNSTEVLTKLFPNAEIIGVDNSSEMIEKARSLLPNVEFIELDVASELSSKLGKFDIVFSNACIQWITDHDKLLPNLMSLLAEGGVLAVQIPNNYDEPIHRIIREVAKSKKFADKISYHRDSPVLTVSEYYDILSQISSEIRVWQTVYYHKMSSCNSILDWMRATGLRPYLLQLSNTEKQSFEEDVLTKIYEEYPAEPCGDILFPFPRLFFTAKL